MNKKGHILVFLTILIWSVAFIGNKILLRYISPIEVMLYRFSFAYIVLLVLYPSWNFPKSVKDELYFFTLGFLGIFFYFLLENFALKYTQATNVGLYMGTIPIFTAILAHFVTKDEKLNKNIIIGFIVAITGIALILLGGSKFQIKLIGDILAIFAALVFALYSVILRKSPVNYNYIIITRKSFFYGIVLMFIYCIMTDRKFHTEELLHPIVYMNIIFLGLFASSLAFIFYKRGVEIIGSVKATNYIYLVPLLTAIFGILILDEKINLTMSIGGILILIGLYTSQKKI